jgi:hypothetical protein
MSWWEWDSISNLGDGNPFEEWLDKSSGNEMFSQSTEADKALYKLNLFNGLPGADFGATDTMSIQGFAGQAQKFALQFTGDITTPASDALIMGDSNAQLLKKSDGTIALNCGNEIVAVKTIPFGDFDGSPTASESTSDTNFTTRWSPNPGGASVSIVAGGARLAVQPATSSFAAITQFPAKAGNFYAEVEWGRVTDGSGGDVRSLRFHVTIGATLTRIIKQGSSEWEASNGTSSALLSGSSGVYSGKVRIRVLSGQIYFDGDIGAGWVNILNSAVPAGDLNSITLTTFDNAGTPTLVTDYRNLVITDDGVDGTGNALTLPSPWAGTVTAVAVANGASSKLVVTDGTDTVEVTGDAGSNSMAALDLIDPDLLAKTPLLGMARREITDDEIDFLIDYSAKYF